MANSNRLHRGITRRIGRYIFPYWPWKLDNIVFIVGCPRSGTSIFGEIISHHFDVLYMYEPRYIWRTNNPRLNIWGADASGQLLLQANDVLGYEENQFQKWFHFALFISGKRQLIEKLPLNLFRVRWLVTMFPKAKFVHLIRNGRDVALSLRNAINQWFPSNKFSNGYWESNWNFQMFEDYANRILTLNNKRQHVIDLNDNYGRALFIWRCCIEEGIHIRRELGEKYILELKYENLIKDPETTLADFFEYIGLSVENRLIEIATDKLHNKSIHKVDPDPVLTEKIAGDAFRILGY